MKFKTKEIIHKDKTYCFVTKGNQKITEEEIAEYFGGDTELKEPTPPWSVPDNLRKMFLSDLRLGVKFCVKKYQASPEAVMSEARRIAPEVNLDSIIKKD